MTATERDTNIPAALRAAGVDPDAITTTPDGVSTVATDDGRICIGADGPGWTWTRYDADDEPVASDYSENLPSAAAQLAGIKGAEMRHSAHPRSSSP